MRALLVTATLILISACSPRIDEVSHSFHSYDKDGVVISETTGGPRFDEELFDYTQVLIINQDENNPESLLGVISTDVHMDKYGSFYVTDNQTTRIVCYDSNGNYSHNIGRFGQGPGEYQSATVTGVGGGLITVWDRRLYRLSTFQTDGSFIESFQLGQSGRIPSGEFSLDIPLIGPSHELILIGGRRFPEQASEGYVRWNSADAIVLSAEADTLASLSTDRVKIGTVSRETGQRRIFFNARPNARYHANYGLVLTTGLESQFDIYGLDGKLIRVIKANIMPEEVKRSERAVVLSHLRQRLREASEERSIASAKASLDHLEFRDPKAFWNDIQIDEYGYIWARKPGDRYWIIQGEIVNPTFRLFSPEGEYLGDTQWPADLGTVTRSHHISVLIDRETGEFDIIVCQMQSRIPGFHYP